MKDGTGGGTTMTSSEVEVAPEVEVVVPPGETNTCTITLLMEAATSERTFLQPPLLSKETDNSLQSLH